MENGRSQTSLYLRKGYKEPSIIIRSINLMKLTGQWMSWQMRQASSIIAQATSSFYIDGYKSFSISVYVYIIRNPGMCLSFFKKNVTLILLTLSSSDQEILML